VIEEHRASVAGIFGNDVIEHTATIRLIESIYQKFGRDNIRIIVDGAGLRSNPELWREIGADGFAADARQALALVDTFR